MKKIIIPLLVCMLLTPMVFAEFKIDDIRGYVNSERVGSVDVDGGTFIVRILDNVDMNMDFINTYNETVTVKLKLRIDNIDDGADIIKDVSYFDIAPNSEKSKQISFSIPELTTPDTYDMRLSIYYKYNGTENITEKDYEVVLKKNVTTATAGLDLYSSFTNLTNMCRNISSSVTVFTTYVDKYNACSDELSTVKEERGTYKAQLDERAATLEACQNDKVSAESEKTTCENEKTTMISLSEHNNLQSQAVKDAESAKDQIMIALVGAGVVGYWYLNRKKQTSTVQGTYYYDKK